MYTCIYECNTHGCQRRQRKLADAAGDGGGGGAGLGGNSGGMSGGPGGGGKPAAVASPSMSGGPLKPAIMPQAQFPRWKSNAPKWPTIIDVKRI